MTVIAATVKATKEPFDPVLQTSTDGLVSRQLDVRVFAGTSFDVDLNALAVWLVTSSAGGASTSSRPR